MYVFLQFFHNTFFRCWQNASVAAMSVYELPYMSFRFSNTWLNFFCLFSWNLFLQMLCWLLPWVPHLLLSLTHYPHSLVLLRSSSSLGSGGNKDDEEELLAGSADQVTPLTIKRSSRERRHTEVILNLVKVSNKQTKRLRGPWTTMTVPCLPPALTWRSPGAFGWRQMWRTSIGFCRGPSRISCTRWSLSTLISLLPSGRVLLDTQSRSTSCEMFWQVLPHLRPHRSHYSPGVIPCIVCCLWVSDLDHHNRGPHQPAAVFFDRPGQYFAEPFSGCPYFVCYPTVLLGGNQRSVTVGFFCLWSLKAQNTVDCGTKFRVIGDETEMMLIFGSKLWVLSHLRFPYFFLNLIFLYQHLPSCPPIVCHNIYWSQRKPKRWLKSITIFWDFLNLESALEWLCPWKVEFLFCCRI